MSRNDKRKEWGKRIANFKNSGLSGAHWCRMNDISYHTFNYWHKKIQRDDYHKHLNKTSKSEWLLIEDATTSTTSQDSLELSVGKVTIMVKPGYNTVLLQQVISVLQSVC